METIKMQRYRVITLLYKEFFECPAFDQEVSKKFIFTFRKFNITFLNP